MIDPKSKRVMEETEYPIYAPEAGCEFLRTWEEGDFKLLLWDTNTTVRGGSQSRLAYEFYCNEKLIFQGADYGCSPCHAVDGDQSVAGLLSFLSLKPGDTDSEWFESYTDKQMEFAQSHGEELGMYAMELEERAE